MNSNCFLSCSRNSSLVLSLGVCQLQFCKQHVSHSIVCDLFICWMILFPFYIRFLGVSLLFLLWIFSLAFSNVRLVWPASSAVTVMQSSTCVCALCLYVCVCVCVSPKLVCNCRWAFEFGVHFAKHSTLGQTFLTFCMNIKPTWDISLGSTHREKHV